jgi:5-phospho-D-xylono-1,4-lactonase
VTATIVDAHCHLWIRPPDGVHGPALTDERLALRELEAFGVAGGSAVVDCQPGDCGRDGRVLRRLAESTGVEIAPATGFHLARYYAPEATPYDADPEELVVRWTMELRAGLAEEPRLRARLVKSAWTGSGDPVELRLMRTAIDAAAIGDGALVVHTERGANAEALADLVDGSRLVPQRVQISHLDKRPDTVLHLELARAGFTLGYDAFLRPKYRPEEATWPLIEALAEAGLWSRLTVGLDLVDSRDWHVAGGRGLRAIPAEIAPALRERLGAEPAAALAGGNAARLFSLEGATL